MGACCCVPNPPLARTDARLSNARSSTSGCTSSSSNIVIPVRERRASLLSLRLESYAWMKQKDHQGKVFYFSVVTGETTWNAPECYSQCTGEAQDLVQESDLPDAISVCQERGITLSFPPANEVLVDPHFKKQVKGQRPKLAHCIFYQPLLVAGLSIYPPEFVRRTGLTKIILADKLHYGNQPRKAIPIFATGTLYLDPAPEIIAYLQDVFHHEYFHMIDTCMADAKLFVARVSKAEKVCDPQWEALNLPHFQYGDGGMRNRQASGFIGLGEVERGFLNTYSMTAVEEDKAEVYAGLIRHPGAMIEATDSILQAKSIELLRRLRLFCPSANSDFWHNVIMHEAYPIKCKTPDEEGTWETRQSRSGHMFWFNKQTNQHSWLNPTFKKALSRPLPSFLLIDTSPSIEPSLPPINPQQEQEHLPLPQHQPLLSQQLLPLQPQPNDSQQLPSHQTLDEKQQSQLQHQLQIVIATDENPLSQQPEQQLQPPQLQQEEAKTNATPSQHPPASKRASLAKMLKIVIDPPSPSGYVKDNTIVVISTPITTTRVNGVTTTILTNTRRAFVVETEDRENNNSSPPASPTSPSSAAFCSSSSSSSCCASPTASSSSSATSASSPSAAASSSSSSSPSYSVLNSSSSFSPTTSSSTPSSFSFASASSASSSSAFGFSSSCLSATSGALSPTSARLLSSSSSKTIPPVSSKNKTRSSPPSTPSPHADNMSKHFAVVANPETNPPRMASDASNPLLVVLHNDLTPPT